LAAGKRISVEPDLRPSTLRSGDWTSWETQKWVFLALAAIYLAARLYHLAAVCLDGDEIFSVGVSRQSWAALTAAAAADSIHPPLFYYLLKIWMFLGNDSLLWVRLLPALFSVASVLPILLLGRELRLRPVEINTTLGIAAVHPYLIFYSQHVRMYTLLMLCALTSLWLFHRTIRAGLRSGAGRYAALTLVNVVLVYSQYYGWLVVGLEVWYVILWKREHLRRAFLSAGITLAAFSPWLYLAATHAYAKGGLGSNLSWIQKPTIEDLTWLSSDFAGFGEFPGLGRLAVAAMVALAILTAAAAWLERRRLHGRRYARTVGFLLFFAVCSIAVPFCASRIMSSSVWGHRHLIFLVAPLLMLVVSAYYRARSRAVRVSGAVLCAAWACLAIQHHVRGDDKKTPFDSLVIQMLAREEGNSGPLPFFSVDKYLHYPIWFYLETLKSGRQTGFAVSFSAADLRKLSKEAARIDVKSDVSIDEARGAHFWVGYTSSWQGKTLPEALMIQRGCRTGADALVGDRFHTITIFPVWCGL